MRYYIDMENEELIDTKDELPTISLMDSVDFYGLCEHLNNQEVEKMKCQMELKNLKHKIGKLIE